MNILDRVAACWGMDSDEYRSVSGLIDAVKPFAHPDLCKQLSANVMGSESPIYARDKAILRLGDFQRASAALARTEVAQ